MSFSRHQLISNMNNNLPHGKNVIRTVNGRNVGQSSGRIYGIVDPLELQRRQQQERLHHQEIERINSLSSISNYANNHQHQEQPQSVSLLSLMYPVSSGVEHKQIFEYGAQSHRGGYYNQQQQQQHQLATPSASVQDLINRRQDLLAQQAAAPQNYLVQLALEDCESQIAQWAAINQQSTVYPSTSNIVGSGSAAKKPEGMSRKEFNKMQPWVRKDSLRNGLTINGGVGKSLLKKMGWREGFGIGRIPNGPVDPVIPDHIRGSDRRGLSSDGESLMSSSSTAAVSGKHPVSVLMELCAKNKWDAPEFVDVLSDGPSHKPHFVIKVKVNDTFYQPTTSSTTKKDAKAMAAVVCLQALGVLSSSVAACNPASNFGGSIVPKTASVNADKQAVVENPPASEHSI